jgi:hypothetical protein
VAARYQAGASVARLAREYGVGRGKIRAILASQGAVRPERKTVDDEAVLRQYDRHGSYTAVATLLGVTHERVVSVLDAHGVPHGTPGRPAEFGTALEGRLLQPGEAARIAGVTRVQLLVASRAGVIRNHGTDRFPRYRRDDVVALRDGH